MINLKIDPEFQNQIPPLTDDEYRQLEENILKEGKLLSPLIVWNNTLVDGHNRYALFHRCDPVTVPDQFSFSVLDLLHGSMSAQVRPIDSAAVPEYFPAGSSSFQD